MSYILNLVLITQARAFVKTHYLYADNKCILLYVSYTSIRWFLKNAPLGTIKNVLFGSLWTPKETSVKKPLMSAISVLSLYPLTCDEGLCAL